MTPRILVLTAGFGEGHNAAARNLAAAFERRLGPGTAPITDLFALASPRWNAFTRRAYLAAINRTPRAWKAVYRWIDRTPVFPRGLWLLARETKLLADLIAAERPAAVCCTFPVFAYMLPRLAPQSGARVPCFNIVTDSISINSIWWRSDCAGWFVPNPDTAAVLEQAGLPRAKIHSCGFPTPAFFADRSELAPPDPAPPVAPRVLYIINSGTHHALETARLLLAQPGWEITCTVGREHALRRQLVDLARTCGAKAEILGWTDRIPQLLMTHHVVIGKAGGATTQEAIAARCPMIVNQIVPGQEEGNYELLRRHRIGALADTPAAVLAACQNAFADRGALWRVWRARVATLARPHAAADIAGHILDQLHASPTAPAPLLARRSA